MLVKIGLGGWAMKGLVGSCGGNAAGPRAAVAREIELIVSLQEI